MSKVTDSIGLNFERYLEERLPSLISTKGDNCTPDFYHSEKGFWIEAKSGNILWGPRIKEYQVENFENFSNPVIYALGFHDFYDAHKRLKQKTERGRQKYLDNNLNVLGVYFIDKSLVNLIWENEGKISAKNKHSYCMVKKGMLNNIFLDRQFKRKEKRIDSAEKFYGFNREDYFIELLDFKEGISGGILLNKDNSNLFEYFKKIYGSPTQTPAIKFL